LTKLLKNSSNYFILYTPTFFPFEKIKNFESALFEGRKAIYSVVVIRSCKRDKKGVIFLSLIQLSLKWHFKLKSYVLSYK
jgi:hypothetical protein